MLHRLFLLLMSTWTYRSALAACSAVIVFLYDYALVLPQLRTNLVKYEYYKTIDRILWTWDLHGQDNTNTERNAHILSYPD